MWSTPRQGTCSEWRRRKRVRRAEVEARQALGDDDREAAVGREVQVVRVVHRDRVAGRAGARVDRRQAVAQVVQDVERLQVPRGRHVLRQRPDGEVPDDLERALVDLVDRVALAVRHVDERAVPRGRPG